MNSRFRQDRAQDDKLKEELTKKLKAFAELYAAEASKDGPYFLGESFSLVRTHVFGFLFLFLFLFCLAGNQTKTIYSRACGVM
jgi:glutathione S-transferase